jgi:quercetin dioxygenase-like cupin family protein
METLTVVPKTAAQRRRTLNGSILNFRLLSKETNDSVATIDMWMQAGTEPPRHVHTKEDEIFTIHSGEILFFIGKQVIIGRKGDVIFAPREVAHHFKLLTPTARVTLTLTPGHFDQYFWDLSSPYSKNELPEIDGPPSGEKARQMKNLLDSFGITMI